MTSLLRKKIYLLKRWQAILKRLAIEREVAANAARPVGGNLTAWM